MPGCAKSDLALPFVPALLLLLLGLGGCERQPAAGPFEITGLTARWANGRVEISCEQRLQLSASAREALQHGVPLTIETQLILRDESGRTRAAETYRYFELRYLPLSEHYRVSDRAAQEVRTFPRLRHALAALSHLNVTIDVGALPTGEYQILARTRLDHRDMPPPMRLPALFDPNWQHASLWVSSPLTVGPEA